MRSSQGRKAVIASAMLLGSLVPGTWRPAAALDVQVANARGVAMGDVPSGPRRMPFSAGEELTYKVRVGRFGETGRGTLRVEPGERIRGVETLRLQFDVRGRVALVSSFEDRTVSWVDAARFTTMRYEKKERSPLSSRNESVEILPEENRWEAKDGGGALASEDPLDELSYLYFVRTLPLQVGDVDTLRRHFDEARNPVVVKALRRDTVTVPAGTFPVLVVEMRVKDPKRWGGGRTLRLFLTDDDRRIPVRFEMGMPVAGDVVLSLETLGEGGMQARKGGSQTPTASTRG